MQGLPGEGFLVDVVHAAAGERVFAFDSGRGIGTTWKLNKNISIFIFVQLGFSVSNWQKVQLNTDLFLDTQKYLYRKSNGLIKRRLKKLD